MEETILNIRKTILEKANSLIEYVDDAFVTGEAAHKVEESLLTQLLDMGHQCMMLLFKHYGSCDVGEKLNISNGSCLNRLPDTHKRNYLSIFGNIEVIRYVYGTKDSQKIDYIPLDAKLQLPKQKFSYLLQNWDQSLTTEMPYIKVGDTLGKVLNLTLPVSSMERINQNMNQTAPHDNLIHRPISNQWESLLSERIHCPI